MSLTTMINVRTYIGLVAGILLLAAMMLSGCAAPGAYRGGSASLAGQPPAIVAHYAASRIRPGENWLLFLRAQDPDGDLEAVVVSLYQPGVGYYPSTIVMVRPDRRREAAGYLLLKTPADMDLLMDRIRAEVMARDAAGNRSAPVKLELRFHLAAREPLPPLWQQVAAVKLGTLPVDVTSTERYNNRGEDREGVIWMAP